MHLNSNLYFKNTYDEARKLFLESSSQGQLKSHLIPSQKDQNLFMDEIYFPPLEQAKTLFLITSGIHGAEGFTGSAIQSFFLSEHFQYFSRKKIGFLFFHGINPFGFKYFRRGTENNVNLNRNFHFEKQDYLFQNKEYKAIQRLLEPQGAASISNLSTFALWWKVIQLFLTTPMKGADFIKGVGMGQFESHQGLEFGGHNQEPQVQVIHRRLKEILPQYEEILFFDLHTGLGRKETLHLIPGSHPEAMDPELMKKYFSPQKEIYEITLTSEEGFYPTHGDFNNFVARLKSDHQKLLALTFEFGTRGHSSWQQLAGLVSIIKENQGYHHGYKSKADTEKILHELRETFIPQNPKWRTNCLQKMDLVFRNLRQSFS